MSNQTVTVELKAKVASYIANLKQAKQATDQLATGVAKTVQGSKTQIEDLSNKSLVVGGALAAAVGMVAKRYADFDKQMSAVAATGDDARASLNGLRQSALDAGRVTVFSATEAAQGIENLLKAGVSAKDVIGGGLTGSLNLAAAGELSVADAAEAAALAMTQFGLGGSDVGHIADLLAAGAGKAQGEVSDLAAALKQSGLVASQFGMNVDDTVGTLSAFANAGLLGSDAGTSFKTMLLQLASPSAKASGLMKDLGIAAYDAHGKFVGITNLAGQLQSKLGGLTQAQRDSALATIFGTDAIRSANVLYKQGADGLQAIIDQTNDYGYAAKVAATRLDNLAGDWEQFSGAVETAVLQSGSGLNAWLRGMTQGATSAANAVGSLPTPLLDAVTRLGALTAATVLVGGGLGKATIGMSSFHKSMADLQSANPRLASGLSAVGKAATAVGVAFAGLQIASMIGTAWQDNLDGTRASLGDVAQALADLADKKQADQINAQFQKLDLGVSSTADAFARLRTEQQKANSAAGVGHADMLDPAFLQESALGMVGVKTASQTLTEQFGKMDEALTTMDSTTAAAAFKALTEGALAAGTSFDEVLAQFPKYRADLQSTATQLGVTNLTASDYVSWMGGKIPDAVAAAADAHPDLVSKLNDTQKAAAGATETLSEYAKRVWEAAEAVLQTSGSQLGFEAALDDTASAVKKLVAEQKKAGKTRNLTNPDTAAGREGLEQLNKLATSTETYTKKMIENGGSQDEVRLAVARARAEFIREATAMGYSKSEAQGLADARGLIPKNIHLETTETGSAAATERLNDLKHSIKGLPKKTQAEILSQFETHGVDAAYTALDKVDHRKAQAWIDSMLDRGGISDWEKYSPDNKTAWINVRTRQENRNIPKALGGLLVPTQQGLMETFAGGGFKIPQLRPFQGADGVTWGEKDSGPWEAFISGNPDNRARSLEVLSDAGRRLGAEVRYASGGVHDLPGYMSSGSVLNTTSNYYTADDPGPRAVVYQTVNYPIAEPTSVSTNKALQTAAALGR